MTDGVLLKMGNLDRDRHAQREASHVRMEDWSRGTASQGADYGCRLPEAGAGGGW